MKKVEITHLVTNGCSLTYGQGLDKNQTWVALVAKKLNVPVVNLAIPGSGNDSIFRRTYEYFYLNKKHFNKPFYIIAWSGAARREEYFDEYLGEKLKDFQCIDLKGSELLEKEILLNSMSEEGIKACERKKLLYWAAVIELFRGHDIPYITTDFINNSNRFVYEYLKNSFPDQYDTVLNDINRIQDFAEISENNKDYRLPCGHDGPETQVIIADYTYQCIQERYDITVIPNKDFVDLNGYRTNNEGMHQVNMWR